MKSTLYQGFDTILRATGQQHPSSISVALNAFRHISVNASPVALTGGLEDISHIQSRTWHFWSARRMELFNQQRWGWTLPCIPFAAETKHIVVINKFKIEWCWDIGRTSVNTVWEDYHSLLHRCVRASLTVSWLKFIRSENHISKNYLYIGTNTPFNFKLLLWNGIHIPLCSASSILMMSLKYILILVWPTSWTPAIGGLIVCVCESVCPKTCRHIARRIMNGWLWNFACMSGTMMPTMCQILVVTQWPN